MAIFTEDDFIAMDYTILRDGGISLYLKMSYLEQDAAELSKAGYQLFLFDCDRWKTADDMHQSLSRELSFPAYYGNNFNAFDDVLTDLDVPLAGGFALVFRRYDTFAKGVGQTHDLAEKVLHLLSMASHEFLLTGRRSLILVQSDDPHRSFPELGGRTPGWNRRERLNKDRVL